MLAGGILLYGFLLSFILSAGQRNRREGRGNPMVMTVLGYVLCGVSAGAAAILPVWALLDPAALATIAAMTGPLNAPIF
jgi:hypothetical protein